MNPVNRPLVAPPGPAGRRDAGGAIGAASIRLAFEPDALTNALLLGDHESTGPLPVGFEFDFHGVRYTHFDLSTDGFMRLGTGSVHGHHYVTLGGSDARPLGAGLLAFDVRGTAPRRRLVLSFAGVPRPREAVTTRSIVQIILHERTGMLEIHGVDAR